MSDNLYMTAEEAAEALGVSVATLYAYVRRKNIRTQKVGGGRTSRYWREDVERAGQRGSAHRRPAGDGELVTETAITAITDDGPYYRGQSAIALSQTESLEAVAALLWRTSEARVFGPAVPKPPKPLVALWPLYADATAIDAACAAFPLIERADPKAYDLSPEGYTRTAGEVMRWFAAIMVGQDAPTAEPMHAVIASRSDDPAVFSDLVRRLLVLSADNELDPTTYVVRAVANTGATPYRAVMAGFSAALGRRTAYGRVATLGRLLDDICTAAQPQDVVMARLRDGDALPGFGGSQRYPRGDPRALALLEALNARLDGDLELRRLNAAIAVMVETMGQQPEFSLINLFLGRRLRLDRQDGAALRLGRIAGWIAHAMEQYEGTPLVRPRAAYVGPLPVDRDA